MSESLAPSSQTRSHSANLVYKSDPREQFPATLRQTTRFIFGGKKERSPPSSIFFLFLFLRVARRRDVNRTKRAEYEYENERKRAREGEIDAIQRPEGWSGGEENCSRRNGVNWPELGRLAPAIYLRNISGRTKNGHATSARFTHVRRRTRARMADVMREHRERIDST